MVKSMKEQVWQQELGEAETAESPEKGWTRKNPWIDASLCRGYEGIVGDQFTQVSLCGACRQCIFVNKSNQYYCRRGH